MSLHRGALRPLAQCVGKENRDVFSCDSHVGELQHPASDRCRVAVPPRGSAPPEQPAVMSLPDISTVFLVHRVPVFWPACLSAQRGFAGVGFESVATAAN